MWYHKQEMGFEFSPPLVSLGKFFITPFSISLAVGGVLYLFFSFIKLADEFSEDDAVSLSLGSFLCFVLGARVGFGLSHFSWWGLNPLIWLSFWRFGGFSFWGGFVGLLLFAALFALRKKWNVWYILEAILFPLVFLCLLTLLGMFLSTANLVYLWYFGLVFLVLLASIFLKNYRSFAWYPSGKPGFLFLSTLALFLFLSLILDFLTGNLLYLIEILKGAVLFFSLIMIYHFSKIKIK